MLVFEGKLFGSVHLRTDIADAVNAKGADVDRKTKRFFFGGFTNRSFASQQANTNIDVQLPC